MVIHKCDGCGKEMAVWLEVCTTVNTLNPFANVGHLIVYNNRIQHFCQNCYEKRLTMAFKDPDAI